MKKSKWLISQLKFLRKRILQIAQRVLEQDYPIDESFQIGTRQSMFITDLEGNQFEIFHDEAIRLLKSNQLCLKILSVRT